MQLKIIDTKKFEVFLKGIIISLFCFNFVLVALGNQIYPKVVKNNLEKNIISSEQRQILLTFNRNMDRKSVEENFKIVPPLDGRFSWNGRNFAFTPNTTLPYGAKFQIKILKSARDENGMSMEKDYIFSFETSPLKLAYIGTEGAEENKLILSDLEGKKHEVLTDGNLKLHSYQIAPDGKGIYFLASKEKFYNEDRNELYFVDLQNKAIKQITSEQKYLNKGFALSPDGKYLVLSRIEVGSDGQLLTRIEAWLAKVPDYTFEKFREGRATGTNIIFTPDSKYLIYRNTDSNFELTSIDSNDEPLFIGEFSDMYDIHPLRPIVAFTRYDEVDVFALNNFLTLYNGDGSRVDLPFGQGIVRDSVFSKDGKALISIYSALDEQFDDQESLYPLRIFHLYRYDIEAKQIEQLTDDMDYSEESPAISPDSKYLLFLRYPTFSDEVIIDPAYREVSDSIGSVQGGGEIWLMDLVNKELRNLQFKGKHITFFP